MTAFLAGFALSISLILAIGAQNAFVLRQGIRRAHVGPVVLACILSEGLLIYSGVAGFGALVERFPTVETVAKWGGAAFVLGYGVLSLWRAWSASDALEAAETTAQSSKSAVLTCLTITFLNPHVYLDTVVLVGAIAVQYGDGRWMFGTGALAASTLFFLILGYGARVLQPLFAKPKAWRILDAAVGILMIVIGVTLIIA